MPAIKPEFMKTKPTRRTNEAKGNNKTKRKGKVNKMPDTGDSTSDGDTEGSDEEWRPDMNRKKRIRGRANLNIYKFNRVVWIYRFLCLSHI